MREGVQDGALVLNASLREGVQDAALVVTASVVMTLHGGSHGFISGAVFFSDRATRTTNAQRGLALIIFDVATHPTP